MEGVNKMIKRGIVYFLIPFVLLSLALNLGGNCEGEDENRLPVPGSPASMGMGNAGGLWFGYISMQYWTWVIEDYPPGYYLRAEGGPVYGDLTITQSGDTLNAYLGLYIYSGTAQPEESTIQGALQAPPPPDDDDTPPADDDEEEPEITIEIFNGVWKVGAYNMTGTIRERSVSLSGGGAKLTLQYDDLNRALEGSFAGPIGSAHATFYKLQ